MQQPFLTGKQPILTGVLFLFLIPITKLYSSIWTQSCSSEGTLYAGKYRSQGFGTRCPA